MSVENAYCVAVFDYLVNRLLDVKHFFLRALLFLFKRNNFAHPVIIFTYVVNLLFDLNIFGWCI